MARLNCGWPILCQRLQLKTFLKMRTRFWSCSPGRELSENQRYFSRNTMG